LSAHLKAPCLIFWGKNDRVFPPEQGRRAAELIKGSELVYFENCGHYPHWEQPALFAGQALRFLIGKTIGKTIGNTIGKT
jgi:pimeloyl-ACP methyl ester carboxylesterase